MFLIRNHSQMKKKFTFLLSISAVLVLSTLLVVVTERKNTQDVTESEITRKELKFGSYVSLQEKAYGPDSNSNSQPYNATCPIQAKFLKRPGPVVALASNPGSGNTWLRYTLEQFTGVLTGSIYNDSALRGELRGEGVHDGSVSVIKTHGLSDNRQKHFDFDPPFSVNYDKAVILLRHPREGMISETNRRFTEPDHTGLLSKERWRSREVQQYMIYILDKFSKFIIHWFLAFPGHKLVVTYENLQQDSFGEIDKIATFLNLTKKTEGIRCLQLNINGNFKRKPMDWDPYISPEVRDALTTTFLRTGNLLKEYNTSFEND